VWFEDDNDLYPVTGPKFGPLAQEQAEEYAAFVRAFAARRLLVGCRRGRMLFTVPLIEHRLVCRQRRIGVTRERRSLLDESDDFGDLVPVQDWTGTARPRAG
jgi:hypothetical protein